MGKATAGAQAAWKLEQNKVPQLGALLSPFFGGSPTKIDDSAKSGYPYSNLSTGGPSVCATVDGDEIRLNT